MVNRIPYFTGWQTFYHERANEERRVEPKTDLMPSYIQEIMTDKSFPFWARETYQLACQGPRPRQRPRGSTAPSGSA